MHRTLACALTALASVSLLPHAAHAQAAFTNGQIEWGMRPDVPRVPYDGETYTQRYAYNVGAPLMFGANPNYLWNLYWADRIDRAQRFGYELPPGLLDDSLPPPPPPQPRRFGLGLGWFRAR